VCGTFITISSSRNVAYCSNGSEHFSYVIAFIGYYEGLSVKINLGASEQDYHRELECAKG